MKKRMRGVGKEKGVLSEEIRRYFANTKESLGKSPIEYDLYKDKNMGRRCQQWHL